MQTYRSHAQWQQLFQERKHFSGTNVEFCQYHHVSVTTYYKHRALLAEDLPNPPLPTQILNPTTSRFVQVKQTTETSVQTHQKTLQFDTRTGHLTLPVNLATADIVAIIKGLME